MPAYSQLCETDLRAYSLYLLTEICSNGAGSVDVVRQRRGDDVGESVGGCDGDGSFAVGVFRGLCASFGVDASGVVVADTVDGRVGGVSSVFGGGRVECEGEDVGLAGSDVGSVDGSLASVSGHGVHGQGAGRSRACGGGSPSGKESAVDSDALKFCGGVVAEELRVPGGAFASPVVGSGALEPGGVVVEELQVSEKTLANRAKRVRKKNRKVRKQGSSVSESASGVAVKQSLSSGVDREVVPEWRRGAGRPSFGGGYFSGCSAEVQEELRESRARMLIQQNDLATRKARAEAQADVVARNAELKRLNLDAKLKVAQERRFGVGAASGFAETVVSYGLEDIIPVPSLSGGSGEGSGSVSPDSSISVAQAARMEKALCSMAEKVKELQLKCDAYEKRVAGSARNAFFNPESEGVTMAEVKDAMVDMSYPAEWHMSQVSETDQRIFAEAGVVF